MDDLWLCLYCYCNTEVLRPSVVITQLTVSKLETTCFREIKFCRLLLFCLAAKTKLIISVNSESYTLFHQIQTYLYSV
jgi:hypothetical protein